MTGKVGKSEDVDDVMGTSEGLHVVAGKSEDVHDVIGMFGKNTCHSKGNSLIELLQNCNLMVCNHRTLLSDPQWTRVQSPFGHKSWQDIKRLAAKLVQPEV